jgi:hypothetical protein
MFLEQEVYSMFHQPEELSIIAPQLEELLRKGFKLEEQLMLLEKKAYSIDYKSVAVRD